MRNKLPTGKQDPREATQIRLLRDDWGSCSSVNLVVGWE